MMRLRSKPESGQEPSPFDEGFRREEQAKHRHDAAVESEDYQVVGIFFVNACFHSSECLGVAW